MEIEIVWVEGNDYNGNPEWTWNGYRVFKSGWGWDSSSSLWGGLLSLRWFSTPDEAKNAAVQHFLAKNPNTMLSKDKSKIITHEGPNRSTVRSEPRRSSEQRPSTTQPKINPSNPVHAPVAQSTATTTHNLDGARRPDTAPTSIRQVEIMRAGVSQAEIDSTAKEPDNINPDAITREMSIAEVLEHLCRHGCKDVTQELDLSKFSEYPISSGGYGDVYRGAFHNGQLVAVKCLRLHADSSEIAEKQLKRAARELYVWSKCDHPNVLGLIGVGQHRNQIAMVSPWMQYGNIRRLLAYKPQTDRYALCLQVAQGIAYLHEEEVIHGDLKGDNVLVSGDIVPKVTDFGNAALREYTLQFSQTTSKAGMSLNWVAPEILEEETGLTAEADVYSLGMTILEIITGSPPYAGLRESIIVRKIVGGKHPTRSEEHIPTGKKYADLLWSLLTSCWEFDPKDRPTSAEVRDKMKDVIAERDKDAGSGVERN